MIVPPKLLHCLFRIRHHPRPSRPIRVRATVALGAAFIAGCANIPPDYTAADAPRYDPTVVARCAKPCVALVLGSGGPRGFAHIGVLKVLEQEGIRPGLIVGASVGSMIGALYASDWPVSKIEEVACEVDATRFIRFVGNGFEGDALELERFVNENVRHLPIEKLAKPLAIVTAREKDLSPQVFTVGNTGVAVRASAAIPGAFPVATIQGVRYVDGDEYIPVPIKIARQLGADVVISVDISAHLSSTPPEAPDEWKKRDFDRAVRVQAELPEADVNLHPDLGYYASVSAEYRRRSIAIAAAQTRKQLPEIRAAIARVSGTKPGGNQR